MTPAAQRMFFALWPSAEAREGILDIARRAARRADARLTRAETLHLTLVFLGQCSPAQVEGLLDGAANSATPSFPLCFDRLGCWKGNGIVWLAPSKPPVELRTLEANLRALAKTQGCSIDPRPYAPHLTLARKAQLAFAEETIAPLAWVAERFALVESVLTPRGSSYRDLASWRLIA